MEIAERGILVKAMLHDKFTTETPFDEEVLKNYIIESGLSPRSRRSIRKVMDYMLSRKHLTRTKPSGFKVKYRRGDQAAPKLGFPRVGTPLTMEEALLDLNGSISRVRAFLEKTDRELKRR